VVEIDSSILNREVANQPIQFEEEVKVQKHKPSQNKKILKDEEFPCLPGTKNKSKKEQLPVGELLEEQFPAFGGHSELVV
jgi:hypothetical protein